MKKLEKNNFSKITMQLVYYFVNMNNKSMAHGF
jgi:hypothetical protein